MLTGRDRIVWMLKKFKYLAFCFVQNENKILLSGKNFLHIYNYAFLLLLQIKTIQQNGRQLKKAMKNRYISSKNVILFYFPFSTSKYYGLKSHYCYCVCFCLKHLRLFEFKCHSASRLIAWF